MLTATEVEAAATALDVFEDDLLGEEATEAGAEEFNEAGRPETAIANETV